MPFIAPLRGNYAAYLSTYIAGRDLLDMACTRVRQVQEIIGGKTVYIDLLPLSNRDVVFDTLFENQEALDAYQVHPEHIKVAEYVGSVIKDRICVDYFI